MWEPIAKEWGKLKKAQEERYKDIWKVLIKESWYFMLGIALDGGKGMGWVGYLFVWPFFLAFVIGILLLIWAILSPFVF